MFPVFHYKLRGKIKQSFDNKKMEIDFFSPLPLEDNEEVLLQDKQT